MIKINNILTSGWEIDNNESNMKNHYQMLNAGIILSFLGLLFGMATNIVKGHISLIYIEIILASINIILFLMLRKSVDYFSKVANIHIFQFTFLFLYLMYVSKPCEMKHVWLFTYPVIILYFKDIQKAIGWITFLILMVFIVPLQSVIEVSYSFYQIIYILVVVLILSLIMYFYRVKIDAAKKVIFEQKHQLLGFNAKLEKEVALKTSELQDMNESLEITVQEKIQELIQKDKLLTVQSKQAVMGEMITMIAHQWRQPLSTITLKISNYQIEQLMHENIQARAIDKTLEEISQTIMYLSETIDDFQTYFHPDKEIFQVNIEEVLSKAVNFALPRLEKKEIKINIIPHKDIEVQIYLNELIQVILNLLNNAIDALIDLDIENGYIDIDVKQNGDKIFILVSDNAGGIDEDNLHRIFEPYFSTKGKNGTGLGLYMSQMIIQKQFNGNLSVESSSEGSTFIIEIPKIIS